MVVQKYPVFLIKGEVLIRTSINHNENHHCLGGVGEGGGGQKRLSDIGTLVLLWLYKTSIALISYLLIFLLNNVITRSPHFISNDYSFYLSINTQNCKCTILYCIHIFHHLLSSGGDRVRVTHWFVTIRTLYRSERGHESLGVKSSGLNLICGRCQRNATQTV